MRGPLAGLAIAHRNLNVRPTAILLRAYRSTEGPAGARLPHMVTMTENVTMPLIPVILTAITNQ